MQAAVPIEKLDPQRFLTGEYLYNDVKAYAALGEHRTAGAPDRRTSEWLKQQLEGFGFITDLHPFAVRQFFLERSELALDGATKIPCFPLWPPRAGAVTAPVGNARGEIAVVRFPAAGAMNQRSGHLEILRPTFEAGAAAIVAITPSVTGEPIALNFDHGQERWPVPILLAGEAHDSAIRAARRATIVIEGRDEPRAEAFEVVGTNGQRGDHFIVSTPSSGWFRCAGERGPGIALWLALARWSSHRETAARFTFVASSGHELHEQGMRYFLEKSAPHSGTVKAWLHLGAGIAAYNWERDTGGRLRRLDRAFPRNLLTNCKDWEQLLTRAFAGVPEIRLAVTDAPPGELAQLVARGYLAFGLVASHPFHHAPGDTAARTTGPEILEPVGEALVRALVELEGV
jgi:hypothetical protein